MKRRLNFIEEIVGNFWRRWSREVFPNLVVEPKWHVEKRNMQIRTKSLSFIFTAES